MKSLRFLFATTIAVMICLGSYGLTRAADKGKRTIKIGGIPASWVSSRIKDSLIAEVISRKTEYNVKIVGGLGLAGKERLGALQDGKVDVSDDISGYSMVMEQVNKRFDPEFAKRFEYLVWFPAKRQLVPLIVHRDLPISSLTDAINEKYPLKIGTARGGSYMVTDLIWETLGAPGGVDAVEKWGGKVDKSATSVRYPPMMREGVLNAWMGTQIIHEIGFEEANAVRPLKVVPSAENEEDLKKIQKKLPEIFRYVLKPGDYKFVDKDTRTLCIMKNFIASPKTPEEVIYNMTKAVFEELKFLTRAHPEFKLLLEPDIIRISKKSGVKYHPGAERYYRETGRW